MSLDRVRIEAESLAIEFDADYGMDHKSGWTVVWKGSVMVQLVPDLIDALEGAIKNIRLIQDDPDAPDRYRRSPPHPQTPGLKR